MSSSEDLSSESTSSFTSASSLFLLGRGRPYVYESTLTLQRISSLLTDGEKQSKDEEDESRPPSSVGVLPDCRELVVTPDGATDPPSLCNLNDDIVVELLLSAEGEIYPGFYAHAFHIKHENITIHVNSSSRWRRCFLKRGLPQC